MHLQNILHRYREVITEQAKRVCSVMNISFDKRLLHINGNELGQPKQRKTLFAVKPVKNKVTSIFAQA